MTKRTQVAFFGMAGIHFHEAATFPLPFAFSLLPCSTASIDVEIPAKKENVIEDTVQAPMSYADVTLENALTTAMKEGQSSSLMIGGKNKEHVQ